MQKVGQNYCILFFCIIIFKYKWRKVGESGKEEHKLLIGEYEYSLDSKNRLILPSKLREDLGEKVIITKGLDGCLFGFSTREWGNFEAKLKTLPLTNKNARDFVRFFLSGAVECEADRQGRFLIPSNLKLYAALDKEVVLTGVGTRIEIWDKSKWRDYTSEENISADQVAENMANLGMLGI